MIRRRLPPTVSTNASVPLIPTDLTSAQVLPKNFLRPCLLLLLREHPAHGYDLLERLRPLGFSRDDPGRLYRALRALETDGLVRSIWEKSTTGPDRRMYELTRLGMEELHVAAEALMATDEVLSVFLSRYSEFVALDRGSRARSRSD
ncbi:MAG TPA: helix-turn-helix transcriptional regulator [Solirubrobacteraceae bacterium]|nr:helix-turn-helix transcriptional regulator [Solirubrobacteraceae bacterium]